MTRDVLPLHEAIERKLKSAAGEHRPPATDAPQTGLGVAIGKRLEQEAVAAERVAADRSGGS